MSIRELAVENGERAMETTREQHPAVLLTDVMMPGLHGFGGQPVI
jgi:YesN/AraC family two-component response regulator